jgi:uncharacterized protein YcaQ
MPFYSRLGPYDMDRLDRWLNDGSEHFEYWGHEASVLPVDRYPLWRWRMARMAPWRRAQTLIDAHPGLMEDVLAQVRDRGPLTVRDLEAPNHRNEPWWGYGPGKVMLEVLFAEGRLAAVRTGNFVRLYDIPERLIPAEHREAPAVSMDEAYRRLLGDAVRHHGIGTADDIADYYRLHLPTARPILARMAEAGEIDVVEVPGWRGPVYLDREASRPRGITGAALLSPFDPVVWYRDRAERLFDFRYRIEIYVPEHKRVHGYYVMPFMLDGALVARVDLKADRTGSELLVRSAFIEEGADRVAVAAALGSELERFAQWLGLTAVVVEDRGDLAEPLRSTL